MQTERRKETEIRGRRERERGREGRKKGKKMFDIFQKNIKYKALSIFNNMKYNSINYHQWTKDILMCNF